jgi:uncharacterized protein GlcG (DUF336 family)
MNRLVFPGLAISVLAPICALAQVPAAAQTLAGAQPPVSVYAADVAPIHGVSQAPGAAQATDRPQAQISVRVADVAPAPTVAQAAGAAQAPAPAARGPSLKLALEAAQKAVATCQGLDQKVGVTVVDSAGVLKVVLATDGASTRGVASSTNKALTALAFTAPTSELGEKIKSDATLAEKIAANPNYNTRAGGVLLKVGDDVIGAIGVGGAKGSEKDEACAVAGLEKVKRRLK